MSSETKFTPNFERFTPSGVHIGFEGAFMRRDSSGEWYEASDVDPVIAELYAALETLLNAAEDNNGTLLLPNYEAVIAALKKARGESV